MNGKPSELESSGRAADESFDETPVGAQPTACSGPTTSAATGTSWVEIELIGEDDRPVVGARYRVKLRDGSTIEGRIGSTGIVRLEGIEPGTGLVSFPDLDRAAWERV